MRGDAISADEQEDASGHDEADLWCDWRERRDEAARRRLIELYLSFARILAGKLYARRHTDEVEFAEYLQLASVGLIEAVDRYDPAQGASFRTYAAHRIQGSILSGLESLTERACQVALRRRMEQERLQSLRSGAQSKESDTFTRLASIAVGLAMGFMLDDVAAFRPDDGAYGDNTYANFELRQLQRRLVKLVGELPERESQIIRHHYFQQIPFDEIATTLGLTKGRVSQLHKRALGMLRDSLGGGEVDLAV